LLAARNTEIYTSIKVRLGKAVTKRKPYFIGLYQSPRQSLAVDHTVYTRSIGLDTVVLAAN